MPEIYYVAVVSQQCKDSQCLDCPGKFQVDKTAAGKEIWQKCDCHCEHPFLVEKKS